MATAGEPTRHGKHGMGRTFRDFENGSSDVTRTKGARAKTSWGVVISVWRNIAIFVDAPVCLFRMLSTTVRMAYFR